MRELLIISCCVIMLSACSTSKRVEKMFEDSEEFSDRRFSYEQIDTLPEPVKKYFKKVLAEGQP